MKRRQFTPEFEAKVVMEMLREEIRHTIGRKEEYQKRKETIERVFFASTFCRKLQVKNTECCIMENT